MFEVRKLTLLCLFLGLEGLACLVTVSGCVCIIRWLVASVGQLVRRYKRQQCAVVLGMSVLLSCALVGIVVDIIVPLHHCMV
jgi:peptidoglycan biosynthesis protein MviN/MurJ (putative lipid II flippase)